MATPATARAILTLLVEGHASYRGLQACLRGLLHREVRLGTIAAVVGEAQQRTLVWMATQAPPTARAIALDEIYGHHRRGAYLGVVDTAGAAVLAMADLLSPASQATCRQSPYPNTPTTRQHVNTNALDKTPAPHLPCACGTVWPRDLSVCPSGRRHQGLRRSRGAYGQFWRT